MKNPTVTLVTLLLVAMETSCFSTQRPNWNNHNNDISVINPVDVRFSDETDKSNAENNNQKNSYSSREQIDSKTAGHTQDNDDKIYRKNTFYKFPIVNEGQLDKSSDKSKENDKGDSRKLMNAVNTYKRSNWGESNEEMNVSSKRKEAKQIIQGLVVKINTGKVHKSDSHGEVIKAPIFLEPSKIQDLQHTNTNIHSPKRRSFKNLQDVGKGYLEEDIFNTHLDEDETSENEDDENDDELSDDEYNEDTTDDNDAYEKYVDEIAKEYGYDSTESENEDKEDESATK